MFYRLCLFFLTVSGGLLPKVVVSKGVSVTKRRVGDDSGESKREEERSDGASELGR